MLASRFLAVAVTALGLTGWMTLVASHAQTQTTQTKPSTKSKKHVDPEINKQFRKANVKEFVKRFENNDREVYARRKEIVKALDLKPGMSVADVGAGTGLFTRLFADQVGPKGKVFAVDISKEFLDHIAAEAKSRGQAQIVTIQGTQNSTGLPENALDVVFLCDVYHHLEDHETMLASIHRALKSNAKLILIEFDRREGKSSDFVLKHVRAGRVEFVHEIESAGFKQLDDLHAPTLHENFMVGFRAVTPSGKPQRRTPAKTR